jgi:hypothetical protein
MSRLLVVKPRRDLIVEFFNEQVDEKSNLLNLSVLTYVQNEWAKECATIMRCIAIDVIFPFMELLGIDDHKYASNPDRNWVGVKHFLTEKIEELKRKVPDLNGTGLSVDKLHAVCITEIVDSLQRQMKVVKFFTEPSDEMDPGILEKMKAATLGNLGCESQFARLDNRLRSCGGAPSLSTLSMKAVVHQNGYFNSEAFKSLSTFERMDLWAWAKASAAAKSFMELQAEWLQNVKAAKELAVQTAKANKKKQTASFNRLLENLRKHGGPLTHKTVADLDSLTEQQVLLEIRFIRLTMNPSIRQQRKVKVPGGNNYMQRFSLPELMNSVRSHLLPESNVTSSVEALLSDVYSQNKYHGKRVRKLFIDDASKQEEWFEGEVTDCYDPGINALYQIVYDDNDEETLTLGELLHVLSDH